MDSFATKGLADVPAGTTKICTAKDGHGLYYRGYLIDDLVNNSNFEEAIYLLLFGELPNPEQYHNFKYHLSTASLDADRETLLSLKVLPSICRSFMSPMDVLRTAISVRGAEVCALRRIEYMPKHLPPYMPAAWRTEIESRFLEGAPQRKLLLWDIPRTAIELFVSLPREIFRWKRFVAKLSGAGNAYVRFDMLYAKYVLAAVSNEAPTENTVRMMNASLILYAEHEFNASAFAARVIASTRADPYSALCGAVGALGGELHGGANEQALHLINEFKTPEEARAGIRTKLARKEMVMGFGHRVYKKGDPRHPYMKEWARVLSRDTNNMQAFEVAEAIEETMLAEKSLFPNVDFYTGIAYQRAGIPTELFTPIFVLGRLPGWLAHISEQYRDDTLIRPTAIYAGHQPRPFVPLDQR